MRKTAIAALAAVLWAAAAYGGTASIVANDETLSISLSNLTFYGFVTDGHFPIFKAYVEVRCGCSWRTAVYTNSEGYYEIYGGDHEGHRGSISAEAKGYLGTCYNIDPFGPSPMRVDFKLIKNNFPAVEPASLGRVKAIYR